MLSGKIYGYPVRALQISGTADYSQLMKYESVEILHKEKYAVITFQLDGFRTQIRGRFGAYLVKLEGSCENHVLIASAYSFNRFFKSGEQFKCTLCQERNAIHKNEVRPTLCNQCVSDNYGDK